MTQRLLEALAGVAAVAVLAGCADEPRETRSIEEWRADLHAATEGPETLAMMSSMVEADSSPQPGKGVTVDFSTSVTPTGAEFSCYGEGNMRMSVEMRVPGGTQGAEMGPFDCAESPHGLDLDHWGLESSEAVSVSGHSSEEGSAWFFVLEGAED